MLSVNHKKNESARQLDVLFADDQASLRELMAEELPRMQCRAVVCADGHEAVRLIEQRHFDLVIVDLDMPGLGGIEVIQRLRELSAGSEAIVLTGKATRESAIAALRLGAFDYLEKPCSFQEIRLRIDRLRERLDLSRKVQALSHRLKRAEGESELVGNHPLMQAAIRLVKRVAPTDSSVLITGETGTGKELVARAIHSEGSRSNGPFLAVNCGSLPENLIESELFGYRKGAFTGADEDRDGLFQVADGGTLFLDEIGELPKSLQSRLLRVLESGEIRRVGDTRPLRVDVRLVSATHRHLHDMVARDLFRQDLMYRINTFEIQLPPLRDRISDVPLLARALYARFRKKDEARLDLLTPAAEDLLMRWQWPGNIRELANVIEYASVLCDQLPIDTAHLPRYLTDPAAAGANPRSAPRTLHELEEEAIEAAITRNSGNKTAAAQQLGISLKTLYNRLNQLSQRAA